MSRIVRWGLILTTLVILGSAALAVKIVFFEDSDVTAPSFVGRPAAEAGDEAAKLGLLVRLDPTASSQPEGTVVSQWPEAGSPIRKGKVVILKVSRGGERLPVPDVRGLEFGEAVRRLSEAGFKVGEILRVSDPLKPAGTVIAQNPAAPASTAATRGVALLVSEGPFGQGGLVPVPDVVGQPVEIALRLIAGSGLSADQVESVASSTVAPGLVISTRPRAGVKAPAGSRILLRVARGSETPPEASGTGEGETVSLSSEPLPSGLPPTAGPSPRPTRVPPSPTPTPRPAATVPPAASGGGQAQPGEKTARIRYQVPPLAQPMNLRIELIDAAGSRVIKDASVSGGEYLSLDAAYRGGAKVLIYLGGDLVWQDRYD
jgi:serine/threonine-protein kinase